MSPLLPCRLQFQPYSWGKAGMMGSRCAIRRSGRWRSGVGKKGAAWGRSVRRWFLVHSRGCAAEKRCPSGAPDEVAVHPLSDRVVIRLTFSRAEFP